MKNRDIISSLFWMVIGGWICYGGYNLELGTLHDPGSGFMFFWLGVIMIGLSLNLFIRALKIQRIPGELKEVFWNEIRIFKTISVLAVLFLYASLFTFLGFILGNILLLIFLFKVVEPQTWVKAVLGAVISTLTAYTVFHLLLGTQLPKGFLGIG